MVIWHRGTSKNSIRMVTVTASLQRRFSAIMTFELCMPLERGSNVLSTGKGFICLSPPNKLKIAVLLCSIYKKRISFSAIMF